jgi:predicted transcriptional regulator
MLERLQDARRLRQRQVAAFSEAVREAERERGGCRLEEIADVPGISRECVYRIARR